jgi:outer membrane murein-binding lipoprotein Lpp
MLVSLTFASGAHAARQDEVAREVRQLRAQSERFQKQLERDVRHMAKTTPRLDPEYASRPTSRSEEDTAPKQP